MDVGMDELIDVSWMNERMNEWMYGWMDDEQTIIWLDRLTD